MFVARANRAGASFTVKVLDFGIAKIVAEAKTTYTDAMGTPLWMAPEQSERGGMIGPPTDVWALGLMAFHALVGKYYWLSAEDPSAGISALMREMVLDPLVPASARAAAYGRADRVPRGFDAWFARAVVRDPRARLPDASVAMRELEPILRGASGVAPTAAPGDAFAATSFAPSGPPPRTEHAAPLGYATSPQPSAPPIVALQRGTELAGPPPGAPTPAATPGSTASSSSIVVRVVAVAASTLALIGLGIGGSALKSGCAGKVCSLEVNDCLARCDKGNGPSCLFLGEMYENGTRGVTKNPDEARRAYERACDRRQREACAALAEMSLDGIGGIAMPDFALKKAKSTCEGTVPVPRGCHVLARIHERGLAGVDRDLVRARDLYEIACKARYGPSCGRLGDLTAEGPEKNLTRARELWSSGCDYGDAPACLALGNDRERSKDVHESRFQAEQAFDQACRLGTPRACAKAAVLRWPTWKKGNETWDKIHKQLEAACNSTTFDPLGCEKRGDVYARGLGLARDDARARGYYQLACRSLDTKDNEGRAACARAKTQFSRGSKDLRLAADGFAWGCENGDPWGCVELGILYESGQGVPASLGKADELFQRACEPLAIADPLQASACARTKERIGLRKGTPPAEANRLFDEACKGGSGHGCLHLAEQQDAAWNALRDKDKTLAAMDARVRAFEIGCTAAAPAVEACVRAEAIQRSRGLTYSGAARSLRETACELDPKLSLCPP
ncbi:MAG: SEL1-like repeat protein [Deltaproteobacteria bacterium]|nr:SEL1-like repeat protein [Deltaproteobacteria bacterium]